MKKKKKKSKKTEEEPTEEAAAEVQEAAPTGKRPRSIDIMIDTFSRRSKI